MKTQIVSSFCVAGLSARTNNAAEATGSGRIAAIWGEFMQNSPAVALGNKIGDELYAVYFNYSADHTGDYTFLLGHKVPSLANLPSGLTGVQVPGGEFAVVTTGQGPSYQVVPAAWLEIWNNNELEAARSYQVDFELYDYRSADPSHAQVDIFLGIRARP
jgi:predicted transcriptional regulator YdeE